jgi:hypothetical protein
MSVENPPPASHPLFHYKIDAVFGGDFVRNPCPSGKCALSKKI